jgi:hypothetical protein
MDSQVSKKRAIVLLGLCTTGLALALGLLSLLAGRAQAHLPTAVNVSGTILTDTTWTATGSPYILTGSGVIVAPGVTLTVEPDVTVMGQSGTYLVVDVDGHVQAAGLVTKPITFTSAADSGPGQWGGFVIWGSATFDQTTIRYGNPNINIFWGTGQLRIENSKIMGSAGYAIEANSDWLHLLHMSNVLFSNNSSNRIYIGGGSYLADDVTLTAQAGLEGYVTRSSLVIPAGITLTVQPSVTLMLSAARYGGLGVEGHLEAVGMVNGPIVFTSDLDSSPGEWGGVTIERSAILRHVEIRHATLGMFVYTGAGPIDIENSAIRSSASYVMQIPIDTFHRLRMSNVTFENNAINRVRLGGTGVPSKDLTLTHQPGLDGYERSLLLTVPQGITLSLNPDVTLFASAVDLQGHLMAQGTASSPITFTSVTDSAPGQWNGIWVSGRARFDHTIFRYGVNNIIVDNASAASPIRIENSQIRDASDNGLLVLGGHVTVNCVSIANNQGDGIFVNSSGAPTVTIASSSIISNALEGVNNDNTAAVDSRYNWWGDASGPSGIGPGTGNAVSGNTLYDPWLTQLPLCPVEYQVYLPIVTRQ